MHAGMQQACLQSARLRHWSANPIFEKKQNQKQEKKKRKIHPLSNFMLGYTLRKDPGKPSTSSINLLRSCSWKTFITARGICFFSIRFFFLKIISLFSCTQELRFQRTINTKQACLMHSMHCARTCTPGCQLRTPRAGPLTSSACR